MRNLSYENVIHIQVHFHASQTHFHMKGIARGLVLKQRHQITLKSPVVLVDTLKDYIYGTKPTILCILKPKLVNSFQF